MFDYWFILTCIVFLLFLDNVRVLPQIHLVSRWTRWALISMLFATSCIQLELSWKPFWLLSIIGFLGWFLFESVYTWFGVKLLSQSEAPLFPLFKENLRANEWPNQKYFIQMREDLRRSGFTKRQSLKAEIYQGVEIRSTVFENIETKIRLQVLFVPSKKGRFLTYFSLYSVTDSGQLLITDNVQMPFGGYYPETWSLDRKPLQSSWKKLLARHELRVSNCNAVLKLWDEDPLTDINNRQRSLERFNVDAGFLFPSTMHDEYGKITWDGRYRLWKEAWLQKYLGTRLKNKLVNC